MADSNLLSKSSGGPIGRPPSLGGSHVEVHLQTQGCCAQVRGAVPSVPVSKGLFGAYLVHTVPVLGGGDPLWLPPVPPAPQSGFPTVRPPARKCTTWTRR